MENFDLTPILQAFQTHPQLDEVAAQMTNNAETTINPPEGSSFFLFLAELVKREKRPILFVARDGERAAYAAQDLELIMDRETLYYPPSHLHPYQTEEVNNANVVLRTEVIRKLSEKKKPEIIVTEPAALTENVVSQKAMKAATIQVKTGETLNVEFLNELLFTYHFRRVDFVSEPGEFSVRGGIVDVFSYAYEFPHRISFFDDEIESIREFDLESQLSTKKVKHFTIVPDFNKTTIEEKRIPFFKALPKNTLLVFEDKPLTEKKIKDTFELALETYQSFSGEIKRTPPQELFLNPDSFERIGNNFKQLTLNIQGTKGWIQSPHPIFNKQFDLLADTLNDFHHKGYKNFLLCSSAKQKERLGDIFEDMEREVPYQALIGPLHEGFIDHDLKMTVFTDHQIFERYQKYKARNNFSKSERLTLNELTNLQIGDYVTHIDHGVGVFGGLKKIDVNGKKQETIKLTYQEGDVLYVSIHSLHKISKFNGKEGAAPKLNRLGSPAWKSLKQKTRKKVREAAFNLIQLYAKRQLKKGHAYAPDSYLQHELEASFLFEDTPDQSKATEDVKRDMESERPMDRLICGDVGFGKTEIAIRAAFKAVTDSKQVAVLVPTTILAFQHYKTFCERLKDFPVNVQFLNRFKSSKQKKEILEDLKSGKLDIIIGTHQLVSKNVEYKDLGLLIVDEEHKFGVNVKEKLKNLRANLDTLALSATPIPRTLQFSLMSARDLSVIKTPPPNRRPVDTQLIGFNEEAIRDAVLYELQRGGQVFIVNNRIQNLQEVAGMVKRLVPEAKIATGHGQMDGDKLEAVMLDFMEGHYDVLVSTTIISSGIDVGNANTIIINNAHQFGLADLHQMRGRVGRSNRKAFCYLIAPPLSGLPRDARQRLEALTRFTDLGAGFNIAMKDLEIRGAGDLLGAEQSGFISEMGFDAYQKILNEAIEELKQNEFADLFKDQRAQKDYVTEVQLDTDLELLIPDDYVNNVEERLVLYNEMAGINSHQELQEFKNRLIDRFGQAPEAVLELFESLEIKWMAKDLGFEKIVLKRGVLLCYFVNNPKSEYYQSSVFQQLIQFVQSLGQRATLKEKPPKKNETQGDLLLRIERVNSINEAKKLLEEMEKFSQRVE